MRREEQDTREAGGCTFCAKFARGQGTQSYDTVVAERGGLVVVPSVGALVEGYLMVVPRMHYRSMGEMPLGMLRDADGLKDEIVEELSYHYSSPVVFEHGTGRARAGSCIEHAHLHFVPLRVNVLSALSRDLKLRRIGGLLDLAELGKASASYLYFEDQSRGAYVAAVEKLPSQYVRRVIAALIGQPERWDYAAFPNYELIHLTLQKLARWRERPVLGTLRRS